MEILDRDVRECSPEIMIRMGLRYPTSLKALHVILITCPDIDGTMTGRLEDPPVMTDMINTCCCIDLGAGFTPLPQPPS